MRERQSASIEYGPCNRGPTCHRLTRSGEARDDSLGLFLWKPSPFFRNGLITRKLDGYTRQKKTARISLGPSVAPHVGGPGPSTYFAVPPVARVPSVTRPVSMIRARPRACRPLQLTAQCEQDRDQ